MALQLKTASDGADLLQLAKKTLDLVKELGEDGPEDAQKDAKAMRLEAAKAIAEKPAPQALELTIVALEQMLVAGVHPQIVGRATADGEPAGNGIIISGKKAHIIKSRIREIMWVVKDALACFKKTGNQMGKGLALKALARVHLCRSNEPDAPMAAMRSAKESITAFHSIDEERREAEALAVASDTHLTKAGLSPFEQVVEDENEKAVQTARQAAALFKKVGDRKGECKALHLVAAALLSSGDEDNQLEAETYAQEALDICKEIKNLELEVEVLMTSIGTRLATSGPQAAIGFAKEIAADLKREGGRPEHEGMALHAAAEVHLSIGEIDECAEVCKEAMRMFDRASSGKGKVAALQTMLQVALSKGNDEQSEKAAEQVAVACKEVGDKRTEGSALASIAERLLTKLCTEVADDTKATTEKKEPPVGLTTEEVSRRAESGLDYANRAFLCFEEIQDEPGIAEVQNIIQATFQKGVDVYCTATEPDHIFTTLELDGVKEKESVLEWSIDFPHAKRLIMKA